MGTVHWEPPIRGDLITLGHIPGPAGLTGGHRRGSLITGPCMNFLCNPVRLKFSTEEIGFPVGKPDNPGAFSYISQDITVDCYSLSG